MVGISLPRDKPDAVAIAAKGQITSRIQDQDKSDKGKAVAEEDKPRALSART